MLPSAEFRHDCQTSGRFPPRPVPPRPQRHQHENERDDQPAASTFIRQWFARCWNAHCQFHREAVREKSTGARGIAGSGAQRYTFRGPTEGG
jgi:hypothetical protein